MASPMAPQGYPETRFTDTMRVGGGTSPWRGVPKRTNDICLASNYRDFFFAEGIFFGALAFFFAEG